MNLSPRNVAAISRRFVSIAEGIELKDINLGHERPQNFTSGVRDTG